MEICNIYSILINAVPLTVCSKFFQGAVQGQQLWLDPTASWSDRLFVHENIRQNVISDTKNLNVCTCVQIPVASIVLDLSSPFAISSRVAKTD